MNPIKIDTGSICFLLLLLFMAGCNACSTLHDIRDDLHIIAAKK